MTGLVEWLKGNWVEVGVALWFLEQTLRAISELTPWKWDDNLVKILTNIIKQVFPKRSE